MEAWHRGLGPEVRERVTLHGRKLPGEVVGLFDVAQVSYCPSAFESFHIASAEALCCGCSVVGGRSVSLASFEWFTGEGDGRLAASDDAEGHAGAILDELTAWSAGERDPGIISQRWSSRLHAPRVAEQVLGLFEEGGT